MRRTAAIDRSIDRCPRSIAVSLPVFGHATLKEACWRASGPIPSKFSIESKHRWRERGPSRVSLAMVCLVRKRPRCVTKFDAEEQDRPGMLRASRWNLCGYYAIVRRTNLLCRRLFRFAVTMRCGFDERVTNRCNVEFYWSCWWTLNCLFTSS